MTGLRTVFLTTTALCLAQSLTPAAAQEVFVLDEITVSANREETELKRSGATVEVVTEEDLEAAGNTRVADFLESLPGVSVSANGPIGTSATLYLRGAPGQYVPVFVDGIEVGDPAAGQGAFDFGAMTTADISRIEVLKGSNSARFGSQAVAGAIDITTKRAGEIGTEQSVAAEYGSYATKRLSYSYATKTEKGEVALTASHVSTNGFSAKDENDGNFEADGFRSNRLSFYTDYQITPSVKLGFNGFVEDTYGEFDDFTGDLAGTPGNDYTIRDSKGARLFSEISAGRFDHKLEYAFYDIERYSCQDGDCDPFLGTRSRFSYQAATDLGVNGRLVFGADTEVEKALVEDWMGAPYRGRTRTNGIFGEVSYAVAPNLDITGSLRHDNHSSFGDFTSGRLAAVYRFADDLILRASIGNGFRAPSLYELYGPYGDSSLEREESRSADISIEKRIGEKGMISGGLFYFDVTNAVLYSKVSYTYAQATGDEIRKGFELKGRYALNDRLTVGGSYTYTDFETSIDPDQFYLWGKSARHDVSLFADYAITEQWSATMNMQHVADRIGSLGDYTVANLGLSYDFLDGKEAYLRVENLFDEEYQLNSGYGTSDRALYVGLRATF